MFSGKKHVGVDTKVPGVEYGVPVQTMKEKRRDVIILIHYHHHSDTIKKKRSKVGSQRSEKLSLSREPTPDGVQF
jgi:hypothetical protein